MEGCTKSKAGIAGIRMLIEFLAAWGIEMEILLERVAQQTFLEDCSAKPGPLGTRPNICSRLKAYKVMILVGI